MSNKPSNLLRTNAMNQLNSAKKSNTLKTLYSGISSAQRAIQQQRYFGSPSDWRYRQSNRGRTSAVPTKKSDNELIYHPWESEYSKINIREKKIKSMTKDPYTPMTRLISHAVERVTTEAECGSPLILANAVKIQTCHIQQPQKPANASLPVVVRYLRRNELMPSEQLAPSSSSVKMTVLSASEYKKPMIEVTNISKIIGTAPILATTDRLLNRAKAQADSPIIIRRPPRKLHINVSRETIMPLSVYG